MFWSFRHLNSLSIDVAAGAMASSLFFARASGTHLSAPTVACMGITVWLIYTADHLLDARQLGNRAATERHAFHQRHFKTILVVFILLSVANLALAFFLPRALVIAGSVLGVLVGLYFLMQQKLVALKELVGAVLYTAGILLPVVVEQTKPWPSGLLVPAVLFFLAAFLNLLLFSWFDEAQDRYHRQASIATALGRSATMKIMLWVAGLAMLLTIMGVVNHWISMREALLFPAMIATLLIILPLSRWFAKDDRYRLLGDLVFLYPAMALLSP